jgi:hypothetical protein
VGNRFSVRPSGGFPGWVVVDLINGEWVELHFTLGEARAAAQRLSREKSCRMPVLGWIIWLGYAAIALTFIIAMVLASGL